MPVCGKGARFTGHLMWVLAAGTLAVVAWPAAAQLRVADNPRYFVDGGKPVVLFGSGIWAIIPDATVDIEDHNTWYAEWRSNANRASLFAFCTAVPDGKGLAPWPRTGPGNARDGLPKFDLNSWNEAFWERLHEYLESCQRHGIYVWLQIFDEPFTEPGGDRWSINPFNAENHINPLPGLPGGAGSGEEAFYDPDNAPLMAVQNALVRRLLDETAKRYGHIVYEIGNEINADSVTAKALEWQRHWIAFFRQYEQERGVKLLLSNNTRRRLAEADADAFDVMNHHHHIPRQVKGSEPRALAETIAHWVGGDFAQFQRPIVNSRPASDPDRVNYPDIVSPDEGRWLFWSYFMSGGHIVGFRTTQESWKDGLAAEIILRNLHRFIDDVPFIRMAPDHDRAAGGALCLAAPGEIYALYLPAGGGTVLAVPDGAGEHTVRWYDPRTGEWGSPGQVSPGPDGLRLEAPGNGDWAALVQPESSGHAQ